MSTPETSVIFCQEKVCKGQSCEYFDGRCNHKMYRPDKPEPTKSICPECGFENEKDAWNCQKCDYPLRFK